MDARKRCSFLSLIYGSFLMFMEPSVLGSIFVNSQVVSVATVVPATTVVRATTSTKFTNFTKYPADMSGCQLVHGNGSTRATSVWCAIKCLNMGTCCGFRYPQFHATCSVCPCPEVKNLTLVGNGSYFVRRESVWNKTMSLRAPLQVQCGTGLSTGMMVYLSTSGLSNTTSFNLTLLRPGANGTYDTPLFLTSQLGAGTLNATLNYRKNGVLGPGKNITVSLPLTVGNRANMYILLSEEHFVTFVNDVFVSKDFHQLDNYNGRGSITHVYVSGHNRVHELSC